MKTKIHGITNEIMQMALGQAKDGHHHIRGEMQKAMPIVRTELSDFAPRLITIRVNPGKICEVIGKGGAVISAQTYTPEDQEVARGMVQLSQRDLAEDYAD